MKDQNPDFKYLFVPELHKSKRWHFHGIGVNCDKLKFENSETTNVQVNNVSSADEIRKYKSLYDDGIITEEEFLNKKKQLLGL